MEISIKLIFILFVASLIKIVLMRSNYLVFLIIIEILMLISFLLMIIIKGINTSSGIIVFILICLIVAGACLGMSALVAVSRSFSKEMELFFIKI